MQSSRRSVFHVTSCFAEHQIMSNLLVDEKDAAMEIVPVPLLVDLYRASIVKLSETFRDTVQQALWSQLANPSIDQSLRFALARSILQSSASIESSLDGSGSGYIVRPGVLDVVGVQAVQVVLSERLAVAASDLALLVVRSSESSEATRCG